MLALEVQPALFVDDLAAEVVAPVYVAVWVMSRFLTPVAEEVQAFGMELSKDKSVCLASSDTVGSLLEEASPLRHQVPPNGQIARRRPWRRQAA